MENLIVLQTQFKFFLPCIYESGFESGIQNQNNTETILYTSTINKKSKKKNTNSGKRKKTKNFPQEIISSYWKLEGRGFGAVILFMYMFDLV